MLTMLVLPTALATNSVEPTGGVISPIIIFDTTITPKCTAARPEPIPIATLTGKKTGTTINRPAATSTNIPISSRMILSMASTTIFLIMKNVSGERSPAMPVIKESQADSNPLVITSGALPIPRVHV